MHNNITTAKTVSVHQSFIFRQDITEQTGHTKQSTFLPVFADLKVFFTTKLSDKYIVKCTTLWFIINHCTCFRLSLFSDLNILQGSVATPLWCSGILMTLLQICKYIYRFVNFENWSAFGEVTEKSLVAWFFLTHTVRRKLWASILWRLLKIWIFIHATLC